MRDESPRGGRGRRPLRTRHTEWRNACFLLTALGYGLSMSKFKIMKAPLLLLRPIRRISWYLLLWTQRHTLALWWHSMRSELQRERPINGARVRRLGMTLAKVTADPRLSNAAELKQLTLTDDVVTANADEHWGKRPLLVAVLTGVDHVNEVRFA